MAQPTWDHRTYSKKKFVKVEQLEASENKTYTPEKGKAFGPVVVNVESGGGGGSEHEITYSVLGPSGSAIEPDSEYGSVKALIGEYDDDSEIIVPVDTTPINKAAAGSWVIVQMTPISPNVYHKLTPLAYIDECGSDADAFPIEDDTDSYFFIMPDKDVTIRAQFKDQFA